MNRFIQVITTADDKEVAEKIARAALDSKLAACVQITRCESIYRWQGRIEQAREYVCVMKSRMDLYPQLEEAIRKIHTYEVPEIVATEIVAGGRGYLAWLENELRSDRDK